MATKSFSKPVRLPQSASDFFSALKSEGYLAKFAAGTMRRRSAFPVALQQMVSYSYPALINGRPLNKVMIVLVGQSGAGKSSTINYLFNDEICGTSTCESLTRTVTEYGKELCATDEDLPSIIGTLSFVDPPGALDVDQTKETLNLATITKFRDHHPDLQPRKGLLNASSKVREAVYPNLVLMVIHAADNRMRGPDSNLRKCLKALDKYRLLDRVRPNLLVVVSHSMTISKKKYVGETARITHLIQEAVHVVLRIRDVKIVFVENMPDDYDMDKEEGCDFYSLPDGQLNHYNLIKAMEDHFDQNGDVLGKLLCGWYFDDNCPEKESSANVLHSVGHTELTDAEVEEALQALASLDMHLSPEDDVIPPKFNFQLLGHGYCPKTESLKNVTVYAETDSVRGRLLGTLYTIPKSFQLTDQDKEKFFPVTSETKELYERNRIALYGLSDDTKLVTVVDSQGRWVKGSLKTKDSAIRFVYEKRLLSAKIPNPESQVKEELKRDLNLLPRKYNETNPELFSKFFMKWGSHFIEEVPMGGYVVAECPVSASTYNEEQGQVILQKLETAFNSIAVLQRQGSGYRRSFDGSNDVEVQKCSLAIEGGEPLQITQLTELTAVKFNDWTQTIKWYPVELQHSFTICPYYALLDKSERKEALMEATSQYLDGSMVAYSPPTTPTYTKSFVDDEPPAMRPAEYKAAVRNKSFHETPKIRREEVAKKMMDAAKLEAKQSNGRCNVM